MAKTYPIAVVMGTYNRAHLLVRSLTAYTYQTVRPEDFVLIIFDDGSNDFTRELCTKFSKQLNIDYIRLEKEPGTWRDSAAYLNAGIAKALHVYQSKYIFITHPEIIPGKDVLRVGSEILDSNIPIRVNFKGYYLTPGQQQALDTVRWEDDTVAVRSLPEFYDESKRHHGHPDYRADAIDRTKIWFSWIFGGFSAEGWKRFGGVFESPTWGAVDVEMLERCRTLGIPTFTPGQDSCYVIHQNHDLPSDVQTPRDENAWKAALNGKTLEPRPALISRQRWEPFNYTPC